MEILISIYMRMIYYCYWLIGMQNIVWICHQHLIWWNSMLSSLEVMILILQRIWSTYQVKTRENTSRRWVMKFIVLWEGTHDIYFQRKAVSDHNMLPVRWSFKCKRKNDWKIRKFKARYCVIGDVHKILSLDPWVSIIQWYISTQWGSSWFFSVL